MDEDQVRKKFACRFCRKGFGNGKSLGGHMRAHLALISSEKHETLDFSGFSSISDEGFMNSDPNNGTLEGEEIKNKKLGFEEGDGETSYGLRENPKKSTRVSDSIDLKENICRECGKGFINPRALSGHLRCHSVKKTEESKCKTCGKSFESMRALFGHMRHHSKKSKISNGSCPIRRKRSEIRNKVASVNSSESNLISYLSEFEEEEEEVALSLILLSSGVRTFDRENFVCFDDQSLNPNKGIAEMVLSSETVDSNTKCLSDEDEEKVKLELKNPKLDDSCDTQMANVKEYKFDDHDHPELREHSCDGIDNDSDSELLSDFQKKSKSKCKFRSESKMDPKITDHECLICCKVFSSGQALGGHKRSHFIVSSENQAKVVPPLLISN